MTTLLTPRQLVEMELEFRGGRIEHTDIVGFCLQGHIRWMGLVNDGALLVVACEWRHNDERRNDVLEMAVAYTDLDDEGGVVELRLPAGTLYRLHRR